MPSDEVGVTAVIPSIPPRVKMLRRALASVLTQTRAPDAISVAIDHDHEGSAATRNRALAAADTEWSPSLTMISSCLSISSRASAGMR